MTARRGLLCMLAYGERFLVDQDQFVIGRARGCDLWIPSGKLSKRQCAIVRRDGRWYVMDLRSTSGTLVDDRRIPGPTALAAGMHIRFGDERIRVVDLDYHAAPGELTRGLDRQLQLSCPPLLCRARISIASMTGSAALEAAVADAIREVGQLDGDRLRFTDPVELVLALQHLHHAGATSVGLHRRVCGIELRVSQHALVFGQAALELLAESTVPALTAWRWLTRKDHVLVPPAMLRGLALELRAGPELHAELRSSATVSGAGISLVLSTGGDNYLLWIDRRITLDDSDGDVVVRGWRGARLAIEPTPTGWAIRGDRPVMFGTEPVDQPLVAGTRVTLSYGELVVLAIYDAQGTSVM